MAAYGAFTIPTVFGQQIKAGHAEYALYGFTAYYLVCLALNWYYYDRKNSGIRCWRKNPGICLRFPGPVGAPVALGPAERQWGADTLHSLLKKSQMQGARERRIAEAM